MSIVLKELRSTLCSEGVFCGTKVTEKVWCQFVIFQLNRKFLILLLPKNNFFCQKVFTYGNQGL